MYFIFFPFAASLYPFASRSADLFFYCAQVQKAGGLLGVTSRGLLILALLLVFILILLVIIVVLAALWPRTKAQEAPKVCDTPACLRAAAQVRPLSSSTAHHFTCESNRAVQSISSFSTTWALCPSSWLRQLHQRLLRPPTFSLFFSICFPPLLLLALLLLLLSSINQVLRSRLYIYEVIIQGLAGLSISFLYLPFRPSVLLL